MPATNSNPNGVLRSDAPWRARAVLCVLAFAATGATAYRMGINKTEPAERYSATATIRHRLSPSDGSTNNDPGELPRPDATAAKQQILSDKNLRRVLRQLGSPGPDLTGNDLSVAPGRAIDRVRGNLQVVADETLSPDELHVSVSYIDEDADRVVRLVNALAKDYREQHRMKLEASVGQDYLEAQDAAERARQQFLKAKGRFDDFIQHHFLRQQALAQRLAQREPAPRSVVKPRSAGTVEAERPRVTEDPEKDGLERQLSELEKHLTQLLIDRTPAHPEVRAVEIRIGRLKERLASIHSQVPHEQSEGTSFGEGQVLESPAEESLSGTPESSALESATHEGLPRAKAVEEYAEAARAFEGHKEALAQAREHYDRLSEAKRRAWKAQLHGANIELDLADASEVWRSVDDSPQLLLVALGAGLAVAVGVGLIKSGFDTDPPLSTYEQAETALPVPILGAIPATGPASSGTSAEPSQPASGLAKIVYGALVVAVCFGFLVLFF